MAERDREIIERGHDFIVDVVLPEEETMKHFVGELAAKLELEQSVLANIDPESVAALESRTRGDIYQELLFDLGNQHLVDKVSGRQRLV